MSRYLFLALAFRHGVWGVLLLMYPAEIGATPLVLWSSWVASFPGSLWLRPRLLEALSYLVAMGLGLRFSQKRLVTVRVFPWVAAPQIFLILCSGISVSRAVWAGQYADGVPRHWAFILADQSPILTFGACMILAFWYYYRFQALWARE